MQGAAAGVEAAAEKAAQDTHLERAALERAPRVSLAPIARGAIDERAPRFAVAQVRMQHER